MSHDRNKMDSSVSSLPQNDTIQWVCHSERSEESIWQHAPSEEYKAGLARADGLMDAEPVTVEREGLSWLAELVDGHEEDRFPIELSKEI